jgi:serine/threonine protein kinase
MSCPSESQILLLLEGKLSPEARAVMEEHADGCAACHQLLTALARCASTPSEHSPPLSDEPSLRPSAPSSGLVPRALPRGAMFADRYVALDVIGVGGMGVVHAAFDRQLDRKVALKLLRADQGDPERLVREAQCLARLSHPNVVVVHDVGVAQGRTYITMEYVSGWTMRRWLEETRPPAGRVLEAYLEAAQGLDAAHTAGLVHRDFKPENVLVGEDARVRVTDFGLSRPFQADEPDAAPGDAVTASHARRSHLEGTPRYIAPERFQGKPADARSDQFSFCVALYEALYGEYPFQVEDLRDLPEAMAKGHVRPPPRRARVPAAIRAALLRGLAAAPGARFASMGALASALRAGQRRRRARLRFWLAALAVVLGLGGTATAALRPKEQAALCQGAEGRLAGVWDEPQKAALERAFSRTELPYAPATWKTLRATLDRYAARWVAAHTDACVATRVRGEQSEQALDLRAACLEQQRSRLSALVRALGEVDRKGAEKAVAAVHRLGDPALCSVAEVIDARLPPPPDRATQEKIAALGERMGAIEVRYNLGQETGPLLSEA